MSGKMRNDSVKNMALASICAALSTTLLTIGFYIGIGEFIWYFASSFVFIPMICKRMLKESVAAFFVTAILCLVMIGFNYIYVLPFVVLFGYYPMLYYWLILKCRNNIVRKFIKLAVFEFGMFMMWKFTFLFVGETDFLKKYMLPILLVCGVALFFMYDLIIMRLIAIINYYMNKFTKKR